MPRAQTKGNRDIEIGEHPHDHLLQCIGLLRALNTVDHLSKENTSNFLKLARISKLHEHAIDLIGLGGDIFEKEDGVFSVYLIGRSERGGQHGKTSTIELRFGSSLLQWLEFRSLEDLPIADPADCGVKRISVDATGVGEI